MSICRWCGAPIRWVHTTAGARMPLNPQPDPEGNVAPVHDAPGGDPRARVLAGAELTEYRVKGWRLWMPHHATCPETNRPDALALAGADPLDAIREQFTIEDIL